MGLAAAGTDISQALVGPRRYHLELVRSSRRQGAGEDGMKMGD